MSDRLVFKFYKSYYDVYNELSEKDKVRFIDALLKKQFEGIEPNLSGMVKFAYLSQQHSINKQVKGWEDKTGCKLSSYAPKQGGKLDPKQGGKLDPTAEEEVKEKEEEKEEEQVCRSFAHLSISNKDNAKLLDKGYSQTQIDGIYDSIENYSKNKSYKSLFLTAGKWLAKEYPGTKPQEIKLKYFKIPHDELFGYSQEVLLDRCAKGIYPKEEQYT